MRKQCGQNDVFLVEADLLSYEISGINNAVLVKEHKFVSVDENGFVIVREDPRFEKVNGVWSVVNWEVRKKGHSRELLLV